MRLTQIRAQETAIKILKRGIASGKVPHAYLFSGPAGVGKHLCATGFSMALNCSQPVDGDACGFCNDCRKILGGNHPDVIVTGLPEGKRQIPIESIRELEKWIGMRPHEGRAKVTIIDPADKMTESAANALLKTLEEPRSGSFLVLVTSKVASLLPTVRSRCQVIRFRQLPNNVVSDILVEKQEIDKERADMVSVFSSGSVEQAIEYLGGELDGRVETVFALLGSAVAPTPIDGLSAAEALRRDRLEAVATLDLMMVVLGELAWLITHPEEDFEQRVLVRRFGDRLSVLARKLDVVRISRFVAATERAAQRIQRNNMNPQLALESVLMTMRGRGEESPFVSGYNIL